MTVTKVTGFRAPYRSQTFQETVNKIAEASGLLAMSGSVATLSGTVTIPPFDFVQSGLIVEVSTSKQVPESTSDAPYFLAVSAQTTSNIDDLLFVFAKSPYDLSSNEVIIGYYDGVEWRKPQLLSLAGINKDINQANIDFNRVGPISGLLTTLSMTNYLVSGGTIVDRQGLRQTLSGTYSSPVVATDSDFARVDRVVYRRPQDAANRVGFRQVIVGGAYASTPTGVYQTAYGSGEVYSSVKVLIGTDNAAHVLTVKGYGESFSITYTKYASNRTTQLVALTTLVSGLKTPDFDAAIDLSNNVYLLYVDSSSDLVGAKFTSSGAASGGPVTLYTHPTYVASKPRAVFGQGKLGPAATRVFYTFQVQQAPNVNKIYFGSCSTTGLATVTSPFEISQPSGDLRNPDVFATDEADIYIAYEDNTTGRIFYSRHNDVGQIAGTYSLVSGNTERIGVGFISNAAKKARILVAENKKVFVSFLQDKGGAVYGLSVWNEGSAYMQQLTGSSESFSDYAVSLDNVLNGLHLSLVQTSRVDYVKLESRTVAFSYAIDASTAQGVANAREKLGAMFHVWTKPFSNTYTTYDSNKGLDAVGPATLTGTQANVPLTANQFAIPKAVFATLPQVGDKVTITNAGAVANNGSKIITAVEQINRNGINDRLRITVATVFSQAENPVGVGCVGAFAAPNGNQALFVKTNSESSTGAYRYDVLDTDILLARIVMPGSVILNYGSSSVGPTPSATDKLIVYGHGTVVDWGSATANTLTLSSGLNILDTVNNFTYSVAAGAYPLADGQALYVVLDTSNFSVTPQVALIEALPFSQPIQILGVIKQTRFVPHAIFSSMGLKELDPGEVQTIGGDLPDLLRARLGIVSDTSFQAYDNALVIQTTDNYPKALSKLDQAVYNIQQDKPLLEVISVGADGTVFSTSVLNWDGSNSVYDILVFINGKYQVQGTTKDYKKTNTTQLTFSSTVKSGAEIVVLKPRTGGGASGFLVAKDEGTTILPVCQSINFIGAGVTATNGGGGSINVSIPGGGMALRIPRNYKNNSGTALPSGAAVAFADDGSIVLADANVITLSDFAGVTLGIIVDQNYGDVCVFGDCPGVLSSLTALPGDLIYLGEIPGQLSLTPPPGLTDTILIIGQAVPPNATNPIGTAPDLLVRPQIVSGV